MTDAQILFIREIGDAIKEEDWDEAESLIEQYAYEILGMHTSDECGDGYEAPDPTDD